MNSFKIFCTTGCMLFLFHSPAVATSNAPPANLINWWAGEGNALDSTGTNNGQLIGSVSYAPAVVNQGFNLTGTNGGYVDVGSLSGLQGAQSITVMAWLNIRRFNSGSQPGFLGAWGSTAPASMFLFSDGGQLFGRKGGLSLAFTDGTSLGFYGATALPTNQWIHVAATWRSSDGALAFYKNGHLEQTSTNAVGKTLNYVNSYSAKIGEWGATVDPNHKLDGIIDEVQVFNRALSSNEVTSVFSSGAGPQVTSQPVVYSTYVGARLTMSANLGGLMPINYVWRKGGVDVQTWNCTTNGLAQLTLFPVQSTDVGNYTLLLSNAVGTVESPAATLHIPISPDLLIAAQPTNQFVPLGSNVVLWVGCAGPGPYFYQWRLNGVDIPGETNSLLAITNFQPLDSGAYTVVVYNNATAITSDPAFLSTTTPVLPVSDNFSDQIVLTNFSGSGAASNTLATAEAGEPAHAGKFGTHSVWISWSPPASGIARFTTRGSSFDTLLAIYTGDALATLQPVTSDDDSGGFLTSTVLFNAQAGTVYRIAIDGLGSASGAILLSWSLNPTVQVIPQITVQPPDQTAAPGAPVVLSLPVTGAGLSYQWLRDGSPIATTTASTLLFPAADETNVGVYTVVITGGMLSVTSQPINVQMNLTGLDSENVRFADKFSDMLHEGTALRLGSDDGSGAAAKGFRAAGVMRGYTGSQVFSTYGATSEPGEPHHCNVVGGASMWFSYYADHNGTLYLNTDGSTFDTILAVYTGPGTDFASLVRVACDNNSGTNGRTSALTFQAVTGTTYYIVVDGVNGATGTAHLNYSLVIPARLANLGTNSAGARQLRVTGRTGMKFAIQATTNFRAWTSLLTTNSATGVFDYIDSGSLTNPSRVYRVLMLP